MSKKLNFSLFVFCIITIILTIGVIQNNSPEKGVEVNIEPLSFSVPRSYLEPPIERPLHDILIRGSERLFRSLFKIGYPHKSFGFNLFLPEYTGYKLPQYPEINHPNHITVIIESEIIPRLPTYERLDMLKKQNYLVEQNGYGLELYRPANPPAPFNSIEGYGIGSHGLVIFIECSTSTPK